MACLEERYSDISRYGIKSPGERALWASWLIFILVLSLAGNITILIASARRESLKLHPVIITVIRHLAACDVLITLTGILPQICCLVANRNLLSVNIRYLLVYLTNYSFCVSPLLICAMTVCKLLLLKYPTRSTSWSRSHGNRLCLAIWVTSLLFPALFLVDPADIYFDYRLYAYNHGYSSDVWKWLGPLFFTLSSFIPNLLMLLTSALLVSYLRAARQVSRRSKARARYRGIITVLLSALTYCLSKLPYSIYHVTSRHVGEDSELFHIYFYRAGATFSYFSEVDNFLIYCCTVKSFLVFLKQHVRVIALKIRQFVTMVFRKERRKSGTESEQCDNDTAKTRQAEEQNM